MDGYKIVLGLDVSSSTIGWGALTINSDNKISLMGANYIKPIKNENIIESLAHTRNAIQELFNMIKPDYIGIEDIILFMKGHSTATTITTLASFNRMVALCAFDYLNESPALFNVMAIRHGLKTSKILPQKEDMPKLVAKHLNVKFPYIYKIKKKSKKKEIAIESFDVADGISVSLYYSLLLTDQLPKKKVKNK